MKAHESNPWNSLHVHIHNTTSYKLDPNFNAAVLPGRTRIVTARYVSGHGRHVLASRSLAADQVRSVSHLHKIIRIHSTLSIHGSYKGACFGGP